MKSLQLVIATLILWTPAIAADWSRFRGPDGSGDAADAKLATTWNALDNILWQIDLPGFGASSPITYGGRIYVACYSGYGVDKAPGEKSNLVRHLVCIDPSDGKIIWDTKVPEENDPGDYKGFVALHGYASGTPAADESGVYCYFGTTGAVAFSHDGEVRWQKSCGTGTHGFGTANSPVLYQDNVIVNASVENGSLVAFNKHSGEQVWTATGMKASWNTPLIVRADNRDELVVNVKGELLAYDPLKGAPLWNCSGISDYICPSVIARDGIVYATGARQNTTIAVKTGGSGDVTDTHRLWELDKGSNVTSPVLVGDHLYWASEGKGIAYCADAKSGELLYQERMNPRPGRIYASPIAASGRVYYVSRDKGAYVVAATPTFAMISHNVIDNDDSIFNASPAVIGDRMLLRSDKRLYCIGTN